MTKIEFIKEIIEYSKDIPRLEAEITYWEELHESHRGKGFYRFTAVVFAELSHLNDIRKSICLINDNFKAK